MDALNYRTISISRETAQKEWIVVDVTDQIVGRLYSKVAKLLYGKYKPAFTPHAGCGNNVIIINAERIKFSDREGADKLYTCYTGYPGRQRFNTLAEPRTRRGGVDKIVRHAAKGILLKGPSGRSLLNNLYVFEGAEHDKATQKLKAIDINQHK